jgi:YHS domain-containing protein
MVLDVVCQGQVDEKTAKWKSEYQGKTYYFCAPMCKQKFLYGIARTFFGYRPRVGISVQLTRQNGGAGGI